jgi:hypothetical protein
MCKVSSNNSAAAFQAQEAARAREEEAARAASIQAGTAQIDEQFGRFNDDFYSQRGQTYMDYYQPQFDEQYNDALAQLTFSLARAGTTNSSIAGDALADLQTQRDRELTALNARRDADVNDFRTRVQNEKSSLVSQLNATADAEAAGNLATSRSSQLYSETPTLVPLDGLFSGVGSSIGAWNSGYNDGSRLSTFNSAISNPRQTTAVNIR